MTDKSCVVILLLSFFVASCATDARMSGANEATRQSLISPDFGIESVDMPSNRSIYFDVEGSCRAGMPYYRVYNNILAVGSFLSAARSPYTAYISEESLSNELKSKAASLNYNIASNKSEAEFIIEVKPLQIEAGSVSDLLLFILSIGTLWPLSFDERCDANIIVTDSRTNQVILEFNADDRLLPEEKILTVEQGAHALPTSLITHTPYNQIVNDTIESDLFTSQIANAVINGLNKLSLQGGLY